MAHLTLLGSGEAFDVGLGNNSALLYGRDMPTVLFDCGYQTPERLWQLPRLYPRLNALCLTHFHADHCFGVVPLLGRFWEEKRKAPLTIIGPRGVGKYIERLMNIGYPGLFSKLPFSIDFVDIREQHELLWGGLRFRFARTTHSIVNFAIRVDSEITRRPFSFAISGDGQMTDESRFLFQDVDLLVHEVYTLKPFIPTHCDLVTLEEFARSSNTGTIGVTHVSRSERKKVANRVEKLAKQDPRWFLAKPGMSFEL